MLAARRAASLPAVPQHLPCRATAISPTGHSPAEAKGNHKAARQACQAAYRKPQAVARPRLREVACHETNKGMARQHGRAGTHREGGRGQETPPRGPERLRTLRQGQRKERRTCSPSRFRLTETSVGVRDGHPAHGIRIRSPPCPRSGSLRPPVSAEAKARRSGPHGTALGTPRQSPR